MTRPAWPLPGFDPKPELVHGCTLISNLSQLPVILLSCLIEPAVTFRLLGTQIQTVT